MSYPLYPRTKERLFQIADKRLAMNQEQFLKWLQAKKLPMPFDSAKWDDYLLAMTGLRPCVVCGSPMEPTSFPQMGIALPKITHACTQRKGHTIAIAIATHFGDGSENAVLSSLGGVCKHNLYGIECDECIKEKIEQKTKETCRE